MKSILVYLALMVTCNSYSIEANFNFSAALPLTGRLAPLGLEVQRGVNFAIDEFKAKNPKKAHLLQFQAFDNQGLSKKTATLTEKLIRERTHLMLGPLTNSSMKTMAARATAAKKPVVMLLRSQHLGQGSEKNIVLSTISSHEQGVRLAEYCEQQMRSSKIFLVHGSDNQHSQEVASGFTTTFSGKTKISHKDSSLKEIHRQIRRFKPKGVLFLDSFQSAQALMQLLKKSRPSTYFVGTDLWDSPRIPTLIKGNPSIHYITHVAPSGSNLHFATDYAERHGSSPTSATAIGYFGAKLAIDAYEKSRSNRPEVLIKTLNQLSSQPQQPKAPFSINSWKKGRFINAKLNYQPS